MPLSGYAAIFPHYLRYLLLPLQEFNIESPRADPCHAACHLLLARHFSRYA